MHFLDPDWGEVAALFEEEGFDAWAGLAISPDERWLLFSRRPHPTSEPMTEAPIHHRP